MNLSEAEVRRFESELLALAPDEAAARYEAMIAEQLPDNPPPSGVLARDLVKCSESDTSIQRAEQLARHAGLSLRTLQRLFKGYVGVSPKFVIQRFRLIEAAECLVQSGQDATTGASIAQQLGYADQAHFIRAFKKLVGTTPENYARRNR